MILFYYKGHKAQRKYQFDFSRDWKQKEDDQITKISENGDIILEKYSSSDEQV